MSLIVPYRLPLLDSRATGWVYPNAAVHFASASSQALKGVTSSSSLSPGASHFSVACWVWLDDIGVDHVIFGKWNSTADQYILKFSSASDSYLFACFDGTTQRNAAGVQTIPAGEWHFVVSYWDGTNVNLSIDANTSTTLSFAGPVNSTTTAFAVGARSDLSSSFMNGRVDCLGFWSKALSSTEITALYNAGVGMAYHDLKGSLLTNLVSYWDLDESTGATTWVDRLSTNNLTALNSPTSVQGKR